VGWGANPWFTEYDGNGRVIFDARFGDGADSYRAYRFTWTGRPAGRPALALRSDRRGRLTAYASWNGATGIARWQVLAGPDPEHLRELADAARTGFETRIELGYVTDRYLAVRARNDDGALVGESTAKPRPAR
jgi:hypothetical protein